MGQPGGSQKLAGRDRELDLLYRGQVARIKAVDREIILMHWMNWSHQDLLECPLSIVQRIWQHIQAEAHAAQAERDRVSNATKR